MFTHKEGKALYSSRRKISLMGDTIGNTLSSITTFLLDGPLSISQIATKVDIDWRTAQQYLEMMEKSDLVVKKDIKNTKTYFLKEKKNYFELPIKKSDSKKISTIYRLIKDFCLKKHNQEPTKTQAYKIIWKFSKQFNLNLPIGWYKYGPCCIKPYDGNESDNYSFNKNELLFLRETTEDYCSYDNLGLQGKIYEDDKNLFYLAKEKLMRYCSDDKKELDMILMDLIKYAPDEAEDVMTDFARTVMLIGWDPKTKELFGTVWSFISTVIFKKTLEAGYYDQRDLSVYFDRSLERSKKDAQLEILTLVRSFVDTKYAQDKKYQSWKKKHADASY